MTHATLAAALLIATPALAQLDDRPEAPVPCAEHWPQEGGRDAFILETWPDGIVPYVFDENVTALQRTNTLRAMELIIDVAKVRFVPRSDEDDYVLIKSSNRNSSYIGRIGGKQTIHIVSWKFRHVIVHEFLHALGDYHEQSKLDRDNYAQINFENIIAGTEHNFFIREAAIPEGPYDFESVMHYASEAFSANDKPTISDLPSYEMYRTSIGQSQQMSDGDIFGLQTRCGLPPRADLTSDNFVNGADLAVLLSAW